ncbi:MAG: site-2 protease family protein, partial [Atopobiaceae bacterium]|nr:site-2 protease family protein [Atopobiaceae bacterium]
MTVLSSVLSAVFWGMLVLSALVFVHEGGHFLVARAFGMRVTEFFLGLPSRYRLSFKSKKIGTEFGITPFLLGGYNRICGMDGEYDDLLAPALAIVQDSGRISVQDLASHLSIEREHAYELLAVLVDMGSIRPYYNEAAGEYAWQPDWPEA